MDDEASAGVRTQRKERKQEAGKLHLLRPPWVAATARRLAAAAAEELDVGGSFGQRRVAPPIAWERREGVAPSGSFFKKLTPHEVKYVFILGRRKFFFAKVCLFLRKYVLSIFLILVFYFNRGLFGPITS